MADSASNGVNRGHLTFRGEGNNNRNSVNYSRVVHYPQLGDSGVTIGHGYDMGGRSQQQVYADLIRAGISQGQARAISAAAGLRGRQAAEFVRQQRATIGEITEQQQAALFNQIFPSYERRAQSVYNARAAHVQNRPEWSELHPAIRDVIVDMVYQGLRCETAAPAAASNNIDSFIDYMRRTPLIMRHEPARNRIGYLESNRGDR
ncbi:pesticin C-terminus-like muramidase [Enterobacillus tribolii]|uniref:Phage lysozyme-like predicted toxin n=1 Tax=Enterobacillus tribolii TaxID=1487935 RepID=A0A370QRV2_9GAMM|nr:pesticin C-terminus-like muramidase [Enterobacillus tribolii]MBW7983548.1 calcium-binding protein [Enterobacillus tribolii]RDK91955.1 phage lysozyme-like predicted toxin [Enterobacillus tribolii]